MVFTADPSATALTVDGISQNFDETFNGPLLNMSVLVSTKLVLEDVIYLWSYSLFDVFGFSS